MHSSIKVASQNKALKCEIITTEQVSSIRVAASVHVVYIGSISLDIVGNSSNSSSKYIYS